MKLVIPIYKDIDPEVLSAWVNSYKEFVDPNLEPVLLHNGEIEDAVDYIWPYGHVTTVDKFEYLDVFKNEGYYVPLYIDSLRMSAYSICGDCVTIDSDAFFVSDVSESSIPKCGWGMTPFRKESYNTTQVTEYNCFPEANNVRACYSGFQVFREDHYSMYKYLFKKNIHLLPQVLNMHNYGEMINCLCHKLNNGVFLQAEWNVMWDDNGITNPIIRHYYNPEGKQRIHQMQIMKYRLNR